MSVPVSQKPTIAVMPVTSKQLGSEDTSADCRHNVMPRGLEAVTLTSCLNPVLALLRVVTLYYEFGT